MTPAATPASASAMTSAQAQAAFTQAKVLGADSKTGDAATILGRHTIMLTTFTAADCPARGVTVSEPTPGHLDVDVDVSPGKCEGTLEPSSWKLTSQGDLIAEGDPHPVTVHKNDDSVEVGVGGARVG
ncbi:hypothetical protein OG218_00370 [Kineococcus sp. NBC_00420]|uniref:hypothetical protein n=1 Tax=Kineococcus sp. NBC_00420 TaxID=2903564 RepID=UPI002E1B31FD